MRASASVTFALTALLLLAASAPATAATGVSVEVSFPSGVTAGTQNLPLTIVATNTSTAAESSATSR